MNNRSEFVTRILPGSKWFDLGWKELWAYRDLIAIFIRRDLVATYKQTVLGPLWFVISPLLTTVIFNFVFGQMAGLKTSGMPGPLFYLSGLVLWNYFQSSFTGTSNTFVANAHLFGKVYFPRLAVPIALIFSNLMKFFIHFSIMLIMALVYLYNGSFQWSIGPQFVFVPLLILLMALLSMGLGILISSLTTKYRDMAILVSFGTGLLMYITPVIYPLDSLGGKALILVKLNPITPLIEAFRTSVLGVGQMPWEGLLYTSIFTLIVLLLGSVVFNRVQRSFMDTV
jgi:lipopolysaccharide transport system permease protein